MRNDPSMNHDTAVAARRTRVRRTAIAIGAIALAIYVVFILSGVVQS